MKRIGTIGVLLLIALITSSCGSDGGPSADLFDRAGMLMRLADKLIIPAYDSSAASLKDLQSTFEGAEQDADISAAEIESLREQFLRSARHWQSVVSFNFGPAEGNLGTLAQEMATFPCDTQEVQRRIGTADTLFADFRRDVRGFAALDYLLFSGTANDASQQLSGTTGSARRTYVRAVVRRMTSQLTNVANAWKTTYRSTFISRSGTDAGSSVSLLLNELNKSFELLKNYKLGLPLGLRAGQTTTEPTKIEAYYSGLSYELLGLHFRSIKEIWSGRLSDGTVIPSFRDYLLAVVNGPRLVEDTEAQIARVDEAYLTISQSQMDVLIRTNPQSLVALHTEMQKLTRFIKSEMSSLLGVSITYSSGDGD